MAIKDIFTMIKADRYTSDGREELIKAQEAVTEDVTYKPGDISRKTGLQKQPDGSWAPVKNAPAQKKGLGGKTLTKGAKHYPTVGEYAENGPIEQRMAMKKLLEKNDTESGSGVPTQGSDWMSLPSGTRITHEGAKEKMAQNNARIETLKKAMEGNSKADNFRLGAELKRLQNENEYISERLPPEKTESPSAPSADWEKDIPNASNEELENIVKLEEKLPRMSEQSRSEFSPKIEKAKAELAKRGETVTKMSDLVAQKSRPESAPTGRQPTPEMLEREKMRKSPEAKARRDKFDAEHPRTETGAPAEIKFEDAQKAINNGQVVQWKDSDGVWHDVDPKTSELVMARDIGTKLRVKTDENGNPVKAKPDPSMDETRSKLLELEKRRKKFEKYPDMDNKIRLEQAALLRNAGFGSRAEFDDFVKTMPTDSAPRILTGDCKIRIKKSK